MLDHTSITSQNQSLRQVSVHFSPSRGQRHEVSCPSRVLSIALHRCHLRHRPQGRNATARGCSALSEEVRVRHCPNFRPLCSAACPVPAAMYQREHGDPAEAHERSHGTQKSWSSNCPLLLEHSWCSRLSSEPLISML